MARFDQVYPSLAWGRDYDHYKHEYFSTPNAVIAGPATPYDLNRANVQVSERVRNIKLFEFNDTSLLRAVKFASRSEVSQRISKGLRCTSFVIGVYQAAMLHAIVKQTVCKFPFKELNRLDFVHALNALLIDAHKSKGYTGLLGDVLTLDLKYAIPSDLEKKLDNSNDWFKAGYFAVFNEKLLHCSNYCASPVLSPKKPVIFSDLRVKSAPSSPTKNGNEEATEQETFTLDVATRLTVHGTPPRRSSTGSGSPRLEKPVNLKNFSLI